MRWDENTNKRDAVGIVLVVAIVVAIVLYMSFRFSHLFPWGRFNITIEPTGATMEVGESRNFTITVVSTGYEGNVTFMWLGSLLSGHPCVSITTEVVPDFFEEPGARFLRANGKLTFTLRVTSTFRKWIHGYQPTFDKPYHCTLELMAFGNYQKRNNNLFSVTSNTIRITTTPS